MHENSTHRWFAFRLRTLMVVVVLLALPLAWVGYSLEWIRQRQSFFVKYSPGVGPQFTRAIRDGKGNAPGLLWLFGEEGVVRIHWQHVQHEAVAADEVRRLFPEAIVRERLIALPLSPGSVSPEWREHPPLRR